jgi:hypothetical protein
MATLALFSREGGGKVDRRWCNRGAVRIHGGVSQRGNCHLVVQSMWVVGRVIGRKIIREVTCIAEGV